MLVQYNAIYRSLKYTASLTYPEGTRKKYEFHY